MPFTEAGKGEIPRIIKLAWDIWPEWYWPVIGPEQIAFMLESIYQSEALETQMENGQQFFVLSLQNRDAGFLAIRNGKLEKLYLRPEFRGKGMGSAMLEFATQKMKEANINFMELNVNRFNPALSFYLRNGFSILREVDIPFGPFFLNDFILRKNLNLQNAVHSV
jgi:GNAT superfamily N-acetyltransferase